MIISNIALVNAYFMIEKTRKKKLNENPSNLFYHTFRSFDVTRELFFFITNNITEMRGFSLMPALQENRKEKYL